jgi:hypothetical protein
MRCKGDSYCDLPGEEEDLDGNESSLELCSVSGQPFSFEAHTNEPGFLLYSPLPHLAFLLPVFEVATSSHPSPLNLPVPCVDQLLRLFRCPPHLSLQLKAPTTMQHSPPLSPLKHLCSPQPLPSIQIHLSPTSSPLLLECLVRGSRKSMLN